MPNQTRDYSDSVILPNEGLANDKIEFGAMDLANQMNRLEKKGISKEHYQHYIDEQIEKIGEKDKDIERYIKRCKHAGEKRKCLVNPEGLL